MIRDDFSKNCTEMIFSMTAMASLPKTCLPGLRFMSLNTIPEMNDDFTLFRLLNLGLFNEIGFLKISMQRRVVKSSFLYPRDMD
jgi:hypothetical protein